MSSIFQLFSYLFYDSTEMGVLEKLMEQSKLLFFVHVLKCDALLPRFYLLSIILFHYSVFHQYTILHYCEAYFRLYSSHNQKFTLH